MTGLLSRWWRMVVGIAAGVVAFAAVFVAVNGTSSTTHGAGGGRGLGCGQRAGRRDTHRTGTPMEESAPVLISRPVPSDHAAIHRHRVSS